jgi:hypothetical protein
MKSIFPILWLVSRSGSVWLQSLKKVQTSATTNISKNSVRMKESAEFYADFETVEKIVKNLTKNVITKQMEEILKFSKLSNKKKILSWSSSVPPTSE